MGRMTNVILAVVLGLQPCLVIGARMKVKAEIKAKEAKLASGMPQCVDLKAEHKDDRVSTKVNCKIGVAPSPNGYEQWTSGSQCSSFYNDLRCVARIPQALDVQDMKKPNGGGRCRQPKLSLNDCTRLAKAVEAENVEEASDILSELTARGPDEWMMVPSHHAAIKLISEHFETVLTDYYTQDDVAEDPDEWRQEVATVGIELDQDWKTLLLYCVGAPDRAQAALEKRYQGRGVDAKESRDAKKAARQECQKITNLDIYAGYHPALKAAQNDFKDVPSTLDAMSQLGVFSLDENIWAELTTLSGIRATAAKNLLKSTVSRTEDLVRTAGKRGVHELELALALHDMPMAGFAEPEGGRRRLRELKLKKFFEEVLKWPDSRDRWKVERELKEYEDLMADGGLKWVYDNEIKLLVDNIATLDEKIGDDDCERNELPSGCTRNQLNCVEFGLKADCTPKELKEQMEFLAELRLTCLDMDLPEDCTFQDVKDDQVRKRACRVAGLPLTCTYEEIESANKRTSKCTELGLAPTCSQDDIDMAEAHAGKCAAAGLPSDCTQEDLEQVPETTTPTTTVFEGKSVCSLTERTSFQFGISLSYSIPDHECSGVLCSYFQFTSSYMGQFFNASLEDKTCSCATPSEASFTFMTYQGAEGCQPRSCWDFYAKEMTSRKAGDRRLLSEMKLVHPKHWLAECVPENEAQTVLPALPEEKAEANDVHQLDKDKYSHWNNPKPKAKTQPEQDAAQAPGQLDAHALRHWNNA